MKIIGVVDPLSEAARLRKTTEIGESLIAQTKEIMGDVAKHGDLAVLDYVAKFDGVRLDSVRVTDVEIKQAYNKATKDQVAALKLMKKRLEKSELAVLKRLGNISIKSDGVTIDRRVLPVESVGCYIPGGKARYPSTVVMCAVPAKVAGVKRIVAISPPTKDGSIDPLTLVAADICGVDEFYKIGGAHGIAALTYGTQSIRPVSKIVGPGGMFVTAAKHVASSRLSVDMVAGPTELLVYADLSADPALVAVDLVSQAEHSPDTVCGLVTTSEKMAMQVKAAIDKMTGIDREEIVKKSLEKNGFVAVCSSQDACLKFINEFAPEHVEIICKNADSVAKKIDSAGLVLVGSDTPSSASDYCLGSNHVLPTMGFGKSRASLSVLDFIKIVNKVKATKKGLAKVDKAIKAMTGAEGLPNHYEAVKARKRK
ncbi:MAG: histidinol dehydrogenase [Nitrososphaera sp.]|nr:histidinol dehydrogenase [Nitrososphaera sp.]